MVLKLLELVACRQVSELLAPVVIQYSSGRLLVVTWPTTYYDSICRRHRHRTHTHWYYMRRTRIHANRVALGHGRHNNILHYLAKFRRQVLIKLTHLHSRYGRCLAHVSDNDLLVSTVVVHRRGRLLQQHLPLGNSWSFLTCVLRLLTCALRRLILRLICLLNLRCLRGVSVEHHCSGGGRRRTLNVVVGVRLRGRITTWLSGLIAYLRLITRYDNGTALSNNAAVETWISPSLEWILGGGLVVLLMLRLRLWLVVVGGQSEHDGRRLLALHGRLTRVRANTGWNLIRLLQHLLIHYALTLPLLFRWRLLLLGERVLCAAQLILMLVSS